MPRGKKSQLPANGDCYESAFNHMMDECMFSDKTDRYTLVHAEVMGQGPIAGTTFGHAFLVDNSTGNVLDYSNGRNIVMPKSTYFKIGQIEDIGNYYEYDWNNAKRKVLEFQHYGPWDLVTSSGL